jgi:SAM-dependent methyltransferase
VLGLCCGRGKSAIVWALRGARKVTGIDLSSLALDIARQNALLNQVAERIGFREMPAEDLDFSDESFGMIVGIDALHHTDLPLCLHEISRVLRKGRRSRSLYRNDCPKSRHDVGSSLSRPLLWDLTLSEPNTLLHGSISSSWPGFSHGFGGLAPPCSSNFAASLSSPPGKPGSTDGMSHCFVPSLGSVRSVTTRQSNCSNRGRWSRWPYDMRPANGRDSFPLPRQGL